MSGAECISLRAYRNSDIDAIHCLLNNYDVSRFLSSRIPFPYTHDDAQRWVNHAAKHEITRVIDCEGQLAGIVTVERGIDENARCGEIGYWLGQPYWGRGIASEAVSLMTDEIFSQTDIVRLFAPVYEPNKASMRVVEKCGYHLEGIAEKSAFKDGRFYDEYIFAKVL